MEDFTGFTISLLLGCVIGWLVSLTTISSGCEKLGGFYIGSTTYNCEVKK